MTRIVAFFFLLFCGSSLMATHNLAGDITYKHISGLTYEITVTIFTEGSSQANSRKQIEIDWGDNTGIDSLSVLSETRIGNTQEFILKRVWRSLHTYPGGAFTYTIRVEDPNRNASVANIDGSVNVPFTVETQLSVLIQDQNNSVQLRNNPLDSACVGALYVYNAGAFDPDGTDSLAYRIAKSKGIAGSTAPGYLFPPASDSIVVDPLSGNLIWRTPTSPGIYNVAILILEYRNGVRISSVLRDLQISVRAGCENDPPQIFVQDEVCVEAGTGLSLNISATDPDNDLVQLSATGEVLEQPILARTTFNTNGTSNPANAVFTWSTNCSDVRLKPYNLSIRAKDDATTRNSISLSNYKTVGIRVVSPGPENAAAIGIGKVINVTWDNLNCPNAEGFFIYRRIDSSGFVPSECIVGVPDNIGYEKIATISDVNITSFEDDNNGEGLVPGQNYCYLITKFFIDEDESYVSNEVCANIEKVVQVITNVSIDSTDVNTGEISLKWSPPIINDSLAFPAPYKYLIRKLENGILTVIDSTNSINDTTYFQQNLNTLNQQHFYRVDLYSLGNGRQLAGFSAIAGSVFLTIDVSDERLDLNWQIDVPWNNSEYTIFKKLKTANTFDSLTTVIGTSFTDTNLVNGTEYCYYIQSSGSYNLTSVNNPLINLSQEVCAIPNDIVPPCPPILQLTADCDNGSLSLTWTDVATNCSPDIADYIIYKSLTLEGDLIEIDRIGSRNDTTYFSSNDSVGGCYAIASVDSVGNISELSNKICTEFCPIYELPNVFTPNGDGINDLFIPIQPYRYVDSIHMVIFNRWGEQVFETENPDILWDGTHGKIKITEIKDFTNQTSTANSDGVYFYVCEVYELSLTPNEPRILRGTVTILNNNTIIEN